MKNYKFYTVFLLYALTIGVSGCKKLVEVDVPTTRIVSESVFANNNTSIGYVTGIYSTIGGNSDISGFLSISFYPGLSGDELRILDTQSDLMLRSAFTNQLLTGTNSNISNVLEFWPTCYNYIYRANAAIEGLEKSQTLTPSIKQQLLGEAKFIRGFMHFYLYNLYGDIPIITTSDYLISNAQGRAPKEQVFNQIIADLKDAQTQLSKSYLAGNLISTTADRVRPTYWAATAMLSRVYLYAGSQYYAQAESAAKEVIDNTTNFQMVPLNHVFLRTSQEAIWQIQPTDPARNTQEGLKFILTSAPTTAGDIDKPFYLNPELVSAFGSDDPRKTTWIGSITPSVGTTYYYPNKYKIGAISASGGTNQTEYSMMIRLSEVYLNRAEARARQNNIAGCVADLNVVRARARGNAAMTVIPDYLSTISQTQAIDACINERRLELFSEMGHRWFDLKRSGKIDEVMNVAAPLKGTSWNTNYQLYPIPATDLFWSTGMNGRQNPGY